MGKRIVVNAGLIETRVAVQDGNVLTELYVEREGRRSIVGNFFILHGLKVFEDDPLRIALLNVGNQRVAVHVFGQPEVPRL